MLGVSDSVTLVWIIITPNDLPAPPLIDFPTLSLLMLITGLFLRTSCVQSQPFWLVLPTLPRLVALLHRSLHFRRGQAYGCELKTRGTRAGSDEE